MHTKVSGCTVTYLCPHCPHWPRRPEQFAPHQPSSFCLACPLFSSTRREARTPCCSPLPWMDHRSSKAVWCLENLQPRKKYIKTKTLKQKFISEQYEKKNISYINLKYKAILKTNSNIEKILLRNSFITSRKL